MSEAELSLINKVELRIALAENDKQFEQALNTYLTPLLLKLSSPYADVRKAVFKIIQDVIPRISAARTIKLPINALLDQVREPKTPKDADPSNVRLYSLLFISRGIDRLTDEEMTALVPKVVEGIASYPKSTAARLFYILSKLLASWKSPDKHSPEYANMKTKLCLDKNPDDEKFLTSKISKFLLLRPNTTPNPIQSPGLSVDDNSFFTRDAGVAYKSQDEIFVVKKRFLELLKSGFDDSSLSIPLMIASVDDSSAINDSSEILFRKLKVNVEDPEFVSTAIALFTGSSDKLTPPVKPVLQERILSLLINSNEVTKHSEISQICSLGLSSDYHRLKQTTVQFIKQISKTDKNHSALKLVNDFNVRMAKELKENINNEGWPRMDTSVIKNYNSAIHQRTLQYEALGNILRSNPDLFVDDLSYIVFLFESLEGEFPELRATIQEALSGLTVHLPSLSTDSKSKLKGILKRYLRIDKNDDSGNIHSCRFVAIKYVNCTYPFNDAESRLLCILGTSKVNRADIIEEAVKGLHPHWFKILQATNTLEFKSTPELLGSNAEIDFPSFSSIVHAIDNEIQESKSLEGATIFKSSGQAIRFIMQTLVMQAVKKKSTVIVADEEWQVRLEKAVEVDKTVQDLLVLKIAEASAEDMTDSNETNSFNLYLSIIFDCFVSQYTDAAKVTSDIAFGEIFLKMIALSPHETVGKLSHILPRLLELLDGKFLNDVSTSQICNAIGIIGSHPSNNHESVQMLLSKLDATSSPSYLLKAKLLATAYLMSRLAYRNRSNLLTADQAHTYINILVSHFNNNSLHSTLLECISQLSIYGVLGPSIALYPDIDSDIEKLVDFVKPKVKRCEEQSVVVFSELRLAKVTNSLEEPAKLTGFEQQIYDTHTSKQIEYIFTSGEALSICAGGWESKALQRLIDIQGEDSSYLNHDSCRVAPVLESILAACNNTKPSLRRAGCIWLLSFVQYLGHLQVIQNKAREIHIAFMKFLADRDELIQESASRGLSLVYEMGDIDLKETLVKGLLKSFTDNNASSALAAGSVEEDTELFDKDVLKTNDGSVSTYKDVLNLASDVGDPSLVYKFMSLAKSSALWSSRKGMAFGLGSILSKSSLDEMLSNNQNLSDRLIPKLYRYKFDPSTSVSKSMEDIWNSLIKDSSKTINENFDSILRELLKSMGNKEWRVRQASSTALNDLIQVVSLEKYEGKLEDIWNMSFRVMDDIKESVRKEATKLTRSLSTILTRTADVESGGVSVSQATEVLSNLIPFLLGNKGLLSDAEEIRNFALKTILKLCKIGGAAIKPFVSKLLDNFIGLMSTLEPEVVNYLVLNAEKYNLDNNDIDSKRLQSLGNSPIMDAIEKLLDIIDESMMDEIVHILQSSIRKSVGLPSKVCGSRILVTLTTKHYGISKAYGDSLFKVATNQITDRNDAIASSYATAAGYISRIASIDAIANYSSKISNLYFDSEDERSRKLAAIASEGVSKYCSADKFDMVASAFLPLAYIGQHDTVKEVSKIFEREWIENTSGNNGVKLYLTEICQYAETYLVSNKYHIRQILAKSIADMSNAVDEVKSAKIATPLFKILIEACKGKSWIGKELVLEALVSFSIKSSQFLVEDSDVHEQVNKIILTEAKRRNRSYQKHSIKLMGNYLNKFYDEDLMETYIGLMDETILTDEYYDEEDDDFDDAMEDIRDSRNKKQKSNKYNLKVEEERLSFIKNLFTTISSTNFNGDLQALALNSIIKLFQTDIIENTWRSKIEVNECLKILIETNGKKHYTDKELDLLMNTWQEIYKNCLNLNNIERVRIETVRNAKRLVTLYEEVNAIQDANKVITQMKIFKNVESSAVVQNEIDKVLE